MLSRKQKDLFYSLFGPLMRINGAFFKAFKSPAKGNLNSVKVHLGPGQKNYIDGWINVDANVFSGKADVWADLRNPLPFKDDSVDFFYSHHVIEHLPNLEFHFRELYRCLKSGGKIRIGGPNGDSAIKKYIAGDHNWFVNFPDDRKSIGGKLENFLFCRQEHLTILTFSFLDELLSEAGFKNIKSCISSKETNYHSFVDHTIFSKEWENDFEFPGTIIVEAEK